MFLFILQSKNIYDNLALYGEKEYEANCIMYFRRCWN